MSDKCCNDGPVDFSIEISGAAACDVCQPLPPDGMRVECGGVWVEVRSNDQEMLRRIWAAAAQWVTMLR